MRLFLLLVPVCALSVFEPQCNCVDRESLGRSTWKLLHDIVDNVKYSEKSNNAFCSLMDNLSEIYPCEVCRDHINEYLENTPVEMTHEWLCTFHNAVNERLNKNIVPC
jgi:cytidine deaminase